MSTVQPSATAGPGRGRQWSAKFNRTVKYFDGNFDLQEASVSGEIKPATDLQGAVSGLGLTPDEIVLALNNAAKAKLITEKTEAATGADAIPEAVLNKFVEPYFAVPRIEAITGKNDSETKSLRMAEIIKKIKGDEDMKAALMNKVREAKENEQE